MMIGRRVALATVLALLSVVAQQSVGQLPAQPLPAQLDARVARAVAGEPFGIFSVEVPLPPGLANEAIRVLVQDAENRIFYPAVTVQSIEVTEQGPQSQGGRLIGGGALIDRLRNAIRGKEKRTIPVAVRVSALYRGAGPLNVQLVGDIQQRFTIQPQVSPQLHERMLLEWWEDYLVEAKRAVDAGDHPTLVQKYLTSMLARRLGVEYVDLDPPDPEKKPLAQPLDTLALLAAIEPLRDEMLEDVLHSPNSAAEANLPVPAAPRWTPASLPPVPPDVVVESIATRVPPECFYLRFGSFNNYVWFQELSTRFGGDIGQAVLMRGFNYEASARMERMLGAKLTAIAKMFGDKLIDDMALIGTDLYVKEGASLGALFSTKNTALLITSMQGDRKAAAKANPGSSLETVTIAGKEVSLLSTADNRLRSFMASDGDYVFVTTSSTLMRRFLEVGQGDPSLASMPSFQWARAWMPEANNYSVFAYFSPEFFHQLVSPQYQIELRRRLESIAHLEIAEVASAAAIAEGIVPDDVTEMQTAGLLPAWFDQRADGARTLNNQGRWIDSLRGARGSYLPIADVELVNVSDVEADGYAKIAAFYQEQWQQMDPLLVGLRRFELEGHPGVERVALEGYVAPFGKQKYGWIASLLGPATNVELALPQDDAAAIQLHMSGSNPLGRPTQDYHLFAGVKDMLPPTPEETKGLIKTLRALQATPAYVGAWPMPGLLDQLPLGLGGGPPDYAGYSRMLGGLVRWQGGGYSLLSFDRTIIDNTIPQLATLIAPDNAQARLRVSNLQGTKLATWINGQWYARGWSSSHGNARLLDSVNQQLKVPGDQALEVAQRLLDVRLQCPLGGEIRFEPLPGNAGRTGGWWTSSAWRDAVLMQNGKFGPPPQYSAPWLNWFRGGKVHLTQLPERVAIVGTIDLELPPLAQAINGNGNGNGKDVAPPMDFDLFQLPFKLFGNGKDKEETKPERKSF
ncbi:MAG: hypothetical protein SFV81_02745 [Pirellulaceae bacterium]|nr:hypothetical protein [Pirellulaceae bacterium]